MIVTLAPDVPDSTRSAIAEAAALHRQRRARADVGRRYPRGRGRWRS